MEPRKEVQSGSTEANQANKEGFFPPSALEKGSSNRDIVTSQRFQGFLYSATVTNVQLSRFKKSIWINFLKACHDVTVTFFSAEISLQTR